MAIKIDAKQLAMLAKLRASLDDCASFFKCHPTTIKTWLKDNYDLSYTEFREQQLVHTKLGLTQKAIELAMGGDKTMMIFCLKNLCGWTDTPAPAEPVEIPRSVFSIVPKTVEQAKAQ